MGYLDREQRALPPVFSLASSLSRLFFLVDTPTTSRPSWTVQRSTSSLRSKPSNVKKMFDLRIVYVLPKRECVIKVLELSPRFCQLALVYVVVDRNNYRGAC